MTTIAVLQLMVDESENLHSRMKRVLNMRFPENVDLVVMPELWLSGAFTDSTDTPSDFIDQFREFSLVNNILLIAGSVSRNTGEKFENSIYIFDHGDYIDSYSKIHLFGFETGEKNKYRPGNSLNLINRYGVDLGFAICYDLRFPELFRKYRSLGTSVYIIPASWPEPRIEHWKTLLRARAIENQAFVIGCNAVGVQGEVILGGKSMVISPLGDIYCEASPDNEEMLVITLDFTEVNIARRKFPVNDDILSDYEKIIFIRS